MAATATTSSPAWVAATTSTAAAGTDYFYGGSGRDTYHDDFQFNQWAVDGMSADDVQQGQGGTCTILAVLASAAAKHANLAANIQYLGNNYYRVRLNDTYFFGLYQRPIYETVYFDGTWNDADAQPSMQRDENGSPTGVPSGDFWTTIYQRAVLQYTGTNWRDQTAVENWSWSETAARNTILGVGNSASVSKSDANQPLRMQQLLAQGEVMTAGTPDFKDAKGNSIEERDGSSACTPTRCSMSIRMPATGGSSSTTLGAGTTKAMSRWTHVTTVISTSPGTSSLATSRTTSGSNRATAAGVSNPGRPRPRRGRLQLPRCSRGL